ncbi:SMC1, partial [Symbiodinium natans]
MQGCVEEVVLDNFKSYEGQVRVGPFKKLTCIVGPNGAGKSNLMDAVSFVLGVRTRHLRGDRLQDLVHRQEAEGPEEVARRRCSVELVYRFERPQEGSSQTKRFRRVIQPSTEARYQIDGQAVSQEAYLASLEEINILSKARNFLVFQGDIEAAAHRQGKELTAFFEQVSGSVTLNEEYEKLASEKAAREDKARDLYTRKRDAQHEKKRMSQQKEEAERYQEMESDRRALQAEFLLFRLFSAESVAEELSAGIAEARRDAEAAAVEREATQQKLGDAEQEHLEASQATMDTERLATTARRDLDQLGPEQTQVRAELQSAKRWYEELSTQAELDDQRRVRLEGQASSLHEKLASLEAELENVRQEARKAMPLSPEQWEQFRQAQEDTERLTSASSQEARELEHELRALAKRRATAERSRREAAMRAEHLQQKVEDLTATAQSARAAHENVAAEAAQKKGEVQELARKCQALRESRRQLDEERQQILEEIQDITATERQIEMERRLTRVCTELSHAVPGVFGRVVNLCNPVQKRFRVAVNVALNGHLDAVITQSIDGARSCVQHLKDRMMAPLTFLPLDNLRSIAMERRLHEALQGRLKLRPALNCISFESSLSRAFHCLLSDVVIADSLDDARDFVFGVLKELGLRC